MTEGLDFWSKDGTIQYGEIEIETPKDQWNYVRIQHSPDYHLDLEIEANISQVQVTINENLQTFENIQSGPIKLTNGHFQNVRQWDQYLLNVKSHQMIEPTGDTYGLSDVLYCPEFTEY